jgi:hypothetical protein
MIGENAPNEEPFPAELDRRDNVSLIERGALSAPPDLEPVGSNQLSAGADILRLRRPLKEDLVNR